MYRGQQRPGDIMHETRASDTVQLVCAILLSCAGCVQPAQAQNLEAYRIELHEQVKSGKLTATEAELLYSRKQDQLKGQAGADNARGSEPPREPSGRGTGVPGLYCQTYPDGRTVCR